MSGARRAAADLLLEVLERRRMLDDALAQVPTYNALTGPDRGFARALASAVLRQLGRLDRGLAVFLDRTVGELDPEVATLLRMGAAQLWLLGTPPHAAVGETVATAKTWPKTARAQGLLNAVLRRAAEQREAFDAAPPTAVWPAWLAEDLETALGRDMAVRLATAQLEEPELHLTPKSGDVAGLAEQLGGRPLSSGSIAVATGDVRAIPGYEDGAWWVQDAAAALPARLLGVRPGEVVLDLCAAPGGKTMQLAAAGGHVLAVDRSAPRLKRLRENLARVRPPGPVKVVTEDATEWRPAEPAAKILLDAPCSALGTLRRHPEGAWIKRPEEIARFPEIQGRLLEAATRMLAPGGHIVYCVCTPRPAEGRDVVEAAIGASALKRRPVDAAEAPGFEASITPEGDLLTVPSEGASHDAFYIARLTDG